MDPRFVPTGKPGNLSQPALGNDQIDADEATARDLGPWPDLGSTRVIGELAGSDEQGPDQTAHQESTQVAPPKKPEKVSVLGDYRLLKKLGEGAMGAVYKARQISTNRKVALKVLFPHIANIPKLVERLYREGRVMGQLDHPNIVQAYGIGEDQGWHYVAMEYVPGFSLQTWLQRRGRFSVGEALHLVLAIARALEYAHGLGIVHRDIKPDNVLISRTGAIKVTDLGMVKRLDEHMNLTDTGHAVGTPWYMPLEQAKNAKDTDGRSDIYALGCLLYSLLVGHPPFLGQTIVEVIQAKEIGTFPPAHRFNPEAPERLDLILAKMTAKLPKYRYQTIGEVIHDLEALGLASQTLDYSWQGDDAAAPVRPPQEAAAVAAADSGDKPSDADLWYVRGKNPAGQASVLLLTTQQVQKALVEGKLPPTIQASRNPAEGFRALAAIREFEQLALPRASKDAADKQSVRYRNLYKQIEEKELQREEILREPVTTSGYWSGILWRCVAAVGVGALAILLISWLLSGINRD